MSRDVSGPVTIDSRLEQIFLSEIQRQARFAVFTIQQFNAAHAAEDLDGMFRLLDEFLGCCARISLMLWPQNPGGQERKRHLRERLKILEDDILKDRRLRNHLEHFDERLDTWAASSQNRNFVDLNVGPRKLIDAASVKPTDTLRHFVPSDTTYIFRSEEFDIQKIAASVDLL